jgi:hypothetical protein
MEMIVTGINVCANSDVGISVYTEHSQEIEAVLIYVFIYVLFIMSRDSTVGIATGCGLKY